MPLGARTPEELETLFEDAFLLRDRHALSELFEAGAVLVANCGEQEARGGAEISRLAAEIWDGDHTFVAQLGRILQADDTALIVAGDGINVVRRGKDGTWRYAISILQSHVRSP